MYSSQISTEDLLQNEDFVAYIKGHQDANKAYWEQWISDHPEMKEQIEESISIIRELSTQRTEEHLSAERIDELWDDLSDKLT